MRKIFLQMFYLIPLYFFIFPGCGDKGNTAGGNSTSDNKRIEIKSVYPTFLPAVNHDSITITGKIYDLSGNFRVYIEVRKHAPFVCDALFDSIQVNASDSGAFSKTIRTDSLLSSCLGQNTILRLSVWLRDNDDVLRDSVYYQWGSPLFTQDSISIKVERWRMPYVRQSICDTMSKCVIRSFDPRDSNYVNVGVSFIGLDSTDRDTIFDALTRDYLGVQERNYSQAHDNNSDVHNKIIFAKGHLAGVGLVGESWYQNEYPPSNYENVSFVYMKHIDSLCPPNGTRNDTTEANLTALHEMMHQLGAIGDFGHRFHTGFFANNCALWDDEDHLANELGNHRYTNVFRICTQHAMQTRIFWQDPPFDITKGNPVFTNHSKYYKEYPMFSGRPSNFEKYSLKMTLAKSIYKQYEPIIANFVLVNHDSKIMNIYNLFDNYSGDPGLMIYNGDGVIYARNQIESKMYTMILTTIEPEDTLVFLMSINNWGKSARYKNNNDNIYFDQFGYFPKGNYKAYFYFNELNEERYGVSLKSNEVTFTVEDLNEVDNEILQIYKLNKYDEYNQTRYDAIITKYPESPFAEHLLALELLPYWAGISENTESDYDRFINKYPESNYLLNWKFMIPYLVAAEKKKGDYNIGIEYLISKQNTNNTLTKALSNKSFIKIMKYYGKSLDEN